jgi:YidC/Oxa1 family membrane protein insertase
MNMMDNKNFIIAIVLSLAILIGWQYFFAPQHPPPQPVAEAPANPGGTTDNPGGTATQPPATVGGTVPAPAGTEPSDLSRESALALSPRVPISTPRVTGSINLVGARLDDLRLNDFHETVDDSSPTIVLLSPVGGPYGYFAEFGWMGEAGGASGPGPDTRWTAPAGAQLTVDTPVTLTYDNGAGLVFSRTIAIDANFMFTVTDAVANAGTAPATITPYGRVTRLGEPENHGWYILHEGLIGVFGDQGLEEVDYGDLEEGPKTMEPTQRGWLGITDKYWAAAMIPPRDADFTGRFVRTNDPSLRYQADYTGTAQTVPAGGSIESTTRLFAGAKQVSVVGLNWLFVTVEGYAQQYDIEGFELLIDWGWFYIITQPMFLVIDWLFRIFGNFGVAILLVTVMVKAIFFPLANKSYKSMSAMKKVQPQMTALRDQYKDDKVKQQQALMELYKKEKINPLAGCWPIAVQIPVFFALYKVLFVTIEMRHAPFFGWIQDLSAPDPTTVFNLFGLIPWTPPHFLMIGIWPLIMGVTMFVQMRLNPTPPDPTQKMIFTWMPVIFTFMLASFPAGLVIYWAWNNTLSVLQQYVIMRRQGVEVDILGNIRDTFRKTPPKEPEKAPPPTAKAIPAPANDDDEEAGSEPAPSGGGKKPAKKTPAKKTPPKKAPGRPRNAGA